MRALTGPPARPGGHVRVRGGPGRGAAWLLLTAVLLAGCAVDVPRVSLLADGEAAGSTANGDRVLGVLPFEDLRSEQQKLGASTTFWPLLLYYRRVGDWMTGSAAFEQDVATAVTRRATAAMSGGRFGLARPLHAASPVPGTAANGCTAGLDYVASGRIRALYGMLRQRFELLLIPAPFIGFFLWRNDKSDARGVADLDIEVWDCARGRYAYQRRLRSLEQEAEATISEAAKLALDDAMQRLRNETGLAPR